MTVFYRPASVRHVRVESVCGQPFDPERLSAVATEALYGKPRGDHTILS